MNLLDVERAALLDDFGGKIDLIMRRPNAGAEVDEHVARIGAEAFNHLSDRV